MYTLRCFIRDVSGHLRCNLNRRQDQVPVQDKGEMLEMAGEAKGSRYVYRTSGVCPPEIHFKIDKGILTEVHFVGGGCPGNALLVSKLLENKPAGDVLRIAKGIACRNGTSCPDQLCYAIQAAVDGRLPPAASFRLIEGPLSGTRLGIIGELAGDARLLESAVAVMSQAGVKGIVCMGNAIEASKPNGRLLKAMRKLNVCAIQGENEWNLETRAKMPDSVHLDPKVRQWSMQLPQVLTFGLGAKRCMAFFGGFIQKLPFYSDYEPYALEMNMVCGLTDFMEDETVFSALEAMLPQFCADVVLFSQTRKWGHWHIGDKDFISVGPAAAEESVAWGLLEFVSGKLEFHRMHARR
jgi:uncharacterized protein (TIGR03905 family)